MPAFYHNKSRQVRYGAAQKRQIDVHRKFGTDRGAYTALRAITLAIPRAGLIAVVGSSGSGKTSLLNVMSGIGRSEAFGPAPSLHRLRVPRCKTHSCGNCRSCIRPSRQDLFPVHRETGVGFPTRNSKLKAPRLHH